MECQTNYIIITAYQLSSRNHMSALNTDSNPISFSTICYWFSIYVDKGNNKITELRTILQRESQNS